MAQPLLLSLASAASFPRSRMELSLVGAHHHRWGSALLGLRVVRANFRAHPDKSKRPRLVGLLGVGGGA